MSVDQYMVIAIPALKDNYIWAIVNDEKQAAIIIDPGESEPVKDFLTKNQLKLSAIFITHHHWDHTNGVAELKSQYKAPVYAPKNDPVDNADNLVAEPDCINLSSEWSISFKVMDIPAHTKGHIAYYAAPALFCGDTLFAAGCGRLFEGSAKQMLASLKKLAALPDNTLIYCAHEYTLQNLKFARHVEPDNKAIIKRIDEVSRRLNEKDNSLPATLATEKETNPFLRCSSAELIRNVEHYAKKPLSSELDVFTYLRQWKDQF